MIEQIIRGFEPEIHSKNIAFNYDKTDLKLFADKDKINQVIVNLISNAIKYTDKNGKINITLLEKDNNIILEISDDGYGIAETDLPYILSICIELMSPEAALREGLGLVYV